MREKPVPPQPPRGQDDPRVRTQTIAPVSLRERMERFYARETVAQFIERVSAGRKLT